VGVGVGVGLGEAERFCTLLWSNKMQLVRPRSTKWTVFCLILKMM